MHLGDAASLSRSSADWNPKENVFRDGTRSGDRTERMGDLFQGGSPVRILAPLIGQCDPHFRRLVAGRGTMVTYSQMLHADAIVADFEGQLLQHLRVLPGDDSAFVVQIAGNDPMTSVHNSLLN